MSLFPKTIKKDCISGLYIYTGGIQLNGHFSYCIEITLFQQRRIGLAYTEKRKKKSYEWNEKREEAEESKETKLMKEKDGEGGRDKDFNITIQSP